MVKTSQLPIGSHRLLPFPADERLSAGWLLQHLRLLFGPLFHQLVPSCSYRVALLFLLDCHPSFCLRTRL